MEKELEAKLAKIEKEHGKDAIIDRVVTVGKDDLVTGYFLHPDFHKNPYSIYSRVMTALRQDKVMEAGTLVINECWIGGDERMLDRNHKAHLSVAVDIANVMGFLPVASTRS